MKIVRIGYGSAAVRASAAVESYKHISDPDISQLSIISAEETAPYSPMFLVDYLTGKLDEEELFLLPRS